MWPRIVLISVIFVALTQMTFAADDKLGIQFFEKHIRPVLVTKCYKCHSSENKQLKGGLALDSREAIRAGGESGKAVVPGNVDDSILMEALRHEGLEMPPDEKLADDVIAKFEQWIRMGAPDPRDGKAPVRREIDFAKAREFWSFKPIQRTNIPQVKNAAWATSTIDRFVLSKLEEQELVPVRDADAAALVRRIYFDLIGLPPTPEQLAEFSAAAEKNRSQAIEDLVERLLNSPQFGERWGRHWLDVVRYAESTGMERNFTFPQAWKYRDYVINAFNNDKPFDRFLREQVAGDLLPHESSGQHRENLVATGFLALGPKSLNETNKEQFAMDVVDDQIDTTFRTFAGLTAGCARCHDHKFDPIPTKEYYGLAGIFRSTETFYGTAAQQGNRNQGRLLAYVDGNVEPVKPGASDDGKNKKAKKPNSESLGDLQAQLKVAEERAKKLQSRLSDANKNQRAKLKKNVAEAEQQVAQLRERIKTAKGDEGSDSEPAAKSKRDDLLMAVLDVRSPADTQLRNRGEPNEKGDVIPRGFLTIASTGAVPSIAPQHSGRLELAEWLVSPGNPLTARVAVNRIWQHLFGRGIVPTVDNFGLQGERPTHPELLDWLATEFTNTGWSTKKLVRTIMLSRTYQLAATSDAKAQAADPEVNWLWRARHRRLEVEAIRDAMLQASGQLDPLPSETGSVVAVIGDGDIGRGITPTKFNSVSNKRSVYLPIVRTLLPEMLQLFDFPEPSNINGQREVTTVPTQALFLMNSPFAISQAEHFAQLLLANKDVSDEVRIQLAYQRTLSRKPSIQEERDGLKFVSESTTSLKLDPQEAASARVKAWTAFCQALFANAEFRYVE